MTTETRTVVIAGGGRGLGRCIGERLGQSGWGVGVLARTASQVEEAADAIRDGGGKAIGLSVDVLDTPALERAMERVAGWCGGHIDALVVTAGQLRGIGPTLSVDADRAWRDLETSVRGSWNAARAVWPWLKDSPRGSITFLVGPGLNGDLAFGSLYGAAQAALARLVESLAVELRESDVRVYALNPGLVPTGLVQHLLDSEEGRRWLPRFTEAFAEGKEVGPEVAAEMADWLLDHRPEEVSGRVIAAPSTPEILETRLKTIA
ncbi:MAG TPA: SDR family oxidoreductase, partial [Isosphaeraceae bacterium]|nr:SDR family oxidoreductase [Isosphaeraceae bacterium]